MQTRRRSAVGKPRIARIVYRQTTRGERPYPVRPSKPQKNTLNNLDIGAEENFSNPEVEQDLDYDQDEALHNLRNLHTETKRGVSQNDYLRQWLLRRKTHLDFIVSMEAPGEDHLSCSKCQDEGEMWRCESCIGGQLLCRDCCRKQHYTLPFHSVQSWTGSFFKKRALWEIGLKLYLGHPGRDCKGKSGDHSHNADIMMDIASDTHNVSTDRKSEMDWDQDTNWRSDMNVGMEQSGEHTDDENLEDPEVLPGQEPQDDDEMYVNVDDTRHNLLPEPPKMDEDGNRFVAFIDVTGIHYLPVVHCFCSGSHQDIDLQYMGQKLFPASYKRVRTAFTFAVLDDFRLSNLECKTSAYQYYQKLRRVTHSAFPSLVVNRYRELRRVSRQYRNLRTWQTHGFAHEPRPPGLGELAMFCASCPQPGINLPDNWKEDPDRYEFLSPMNLLIVQVEIFILGALLWMEISRQITLNKKKTTMTSD